MTGWTDLGGNENLTCRMTSGKTGAPTYAKQQTATPQSPVIYFPRLPAGSTVHAATVTLCLIADAKGSGATWQYAPIESTVVEPFFNFRSLGSRVINSPQTFQNTYWYLVSPYACNAVTSQPFTFEFPPESLPGFVNLQYPSMSFKTNFTHDWPVTPYFWIDGYEYTIEYTPPPPLELFPSASLPEEQRRVLLSINSDDPNRYSSSLQSGPATMLVGGKTRDADSKGASRTIHIRVIDPPDPSPYRGGDAKRGDNDGRLVLTAAYGTTIDSWGKDSDGNDVYAVTSDASGDFRIYARAAEDPNKPHPGPSAGDNYIIEAAWPDENGQPGFADCEQTGCPQTGEIQVWKRAYVEADRMFKSGAFLTESVSASPNAPVKVKLESIPKGVGKGKYLMFIHAPAIGGSGTFWSEVVKVTETPNKKTNEVTVERLQNAYEGPESIGDDPYRYLADAVGLVSTATGPSDGDLYQTDTGLLKALYAQSFVEYVFLSNDPVPYLPYERDLTEVGIARLDSMNLIPGKWFFNQGAHNTQHLLAGTNRSPNPALGLATAMPGEPWAWIFEDTIKSSGPTFASQRDRLRREATVHELTHNWGVGHDDTTTGSEQTQWSSATLLCTMVRLWYCGSNVCTEFYDDVVAFHYIVQDDGTPHSEYLLIRKEADPLPY